MLGNRTAWILFISLMALLGLLKLWPLVQVIGGGCWDHGRLTGRYFAGVFRNPIYFEGLRNSFAIACGATVLACLCAVPLAWLAHRYRFPGRELFAAMILVPMILPPFVGAIGLMQMLGPYGAINALFGLGPVDWLGQSRYLGVVVFFLIRNRFSGSAGTRPLMPA